VANASRSEVHQDPRARLHRLGQGRDDPLRQTRPRPLYARFLIEEDEIQTIRRLTETAPSVDRVYRVDLKDAAGVVHASVEKTIYIRKNDARRRNP
jgi:hypothetical protein